ncbi:hypothetical protein KUV89_08390 [Marinobacter hydrocarbonoclasticus]|nr:hypothetical protein [Marinobacter nauticus]
MTRRMLVSLLALSLTACGGSDSDSDPGLPDPAELTVSLSQPADEMGPSQAISLYAHVPERNSSVFRFQWEQTGGPAVNIANPRSPIAAFDLAGSGNYRFELTLLDHAGNALSQTVSFTPTGSDDRFNISRDHMVTEGNRVSLRVQSYRSTDPETGNTVWATPGNIRWTQISGPTIRDWVNEEPELLLFNAPQVSTDTELVFRATGTVSDGIQGQDTVRILITNEAATPADSLMALVAEGLNKPGFARVSAYRPDSRWVTALERCVYDTQITAPCPLSDLPLIGSEAGGDPTIEQVLDRVVVSHPWMGEQFEAFLRQQEQDGNTDFRRLLGSVTGIVLSYDVRPSFYWVGTGAIYLDPEDLWMSPWQRDTINEAPDYRSGFGSELQFLMPWRYTRENEYASINYSRKARLDRPMAELEPDLASLLYHELAHSNDFFPRSVQPGLSAPTLWEAYLARAEAGIVSDSLTASYPLSSAPMFSLAGVNFAGEDPTLAEKNYTPSNVTGFFEPDRATDFYAYSTEREDLAMLFEEAMMQHRYGIVRDVAVTSLRSPIDELDLIVDWGQRGRIGEAKMAARLELVLNAILPEVTGLIPQLETPVPMRPGEDWFDNLILSPATPAPALAPLRHGLNPGHAQGRWYSGPRHTHQLPTPQ